MSSTENLVDICRRGYDDYEEGRMEDVYAALDPEISFDHQGGFVTPQAVRGLDDYRRLSAEIEDTYRVFDISDRRYCEAGANSVLLTAVLRMVRHGSEEQETREMAWLWSFRDGRFHRGREFPDHESAFAELRDARNS